MTQNLAMIDIPKSVNGYKEGEDAEEKIAIAFMLLYQVMMDNKWKLASIILVPVLRTVMKTCYVWYNTWWTTQHYFLPKL